MKNKHTTGHRHLPVRRRGPGADANLDHLPATRSQEGSLWQPGGPRPAQKRGSRLGKRDELVGRQVPEEVVPDVLRGRLYRLDDRLHAGQDFRLGVVVHVAL
jgi:hypothetical protein